MFIVNDFVEYHKIKKFVQNYLIKGTIQYSMQLSNY